MATAPEFRAGRYVRQPSGYTAFIPAPLPPDPPISFTPRLISLLSDAADAVGRLDGVTQTLPNPDLFVAMYVRREAVLSSQMEGTISTLDDVLAFELDPRAPTLPRDVEDVVNYVKAMNYGLGRLEELPLSLRLIREIHGQLLQSGRGAQREPGEFRRSQNWIGPEGAALRDATFIPPPPYELNNALDNLEDSFRKTYDLPLLVRCALIHAQFETIHPFLDGNGRVGRLLITFLLVHEDRLHRPLLYLSYFFKRRRAEYYDRLMAIRDQGAWEPWLEFFLAGVKETADEAVDTARSIVALRDAHRSLLTARTSINAVRALDLLFRQPLINVTKLAGFLDVTFATANNVIVQLQGLDILREVTGGRRNRVFEYTPYLSLFRDGDGEEDDVPIETTQQ